jgi:hypothetical protein
MRNDPVFEKRANSFLRTWLGERKQKKSNKKITNALYKRLAKKINKKSYKIIPLK